MVEEGIVVLYTYFRLSCLVLVEEGIAAGMKEEYKYGLTVVY